MSNGRSPTVALGALRALFRRVLALYFSEIEVVGAPPDAGVGGRLFAANHVNGLLDPLLVLVHSPCAVSPVGKAPLFRMPVLKWLLAAVDAVPIVRRRDDPNKSAAANDEVFDRVGAHLGGGGNILIFPEGTSHNEPHLVPMRSGAGRMLARARERGGVGLTFQAVGLEFEARDVFRSRALLAYGPPRSVDELADGASGEDLAHRIIERLRDDLAALLVEGTTWDERRLIGRVAELYAHENGDPSLAGWNRIGQEVEATRAALASIAPDTHAALAREVDAYYAALDAAGVGDDEVVAGGIARRPGATLRGAALLVVAPLALVGTVLYWAPYQVPRLVAGRASTDVVSTYKLAAGLVVFPLWAGALLTACFLALTTPASLVAAAVALASPFAALAWLDRAPRIARSARAARLGAEGMKRLRAQRDELVARLQAVRVALEGAA